MKKGKVAFHNEDCTVHVDVSQTSDEDDLSVTVKAKITRYQVEELIALLRQAIDVYDRQPKIYDRCP
jgi:hypothetical protein